MVAQIDNDLPTPVRVVLDQEQDEDCQIYLDYDEPDATKEYTTGRLIAVSNRTTAEYTITDDFQIPIHNIRDVISEQDDDAQRIWLHGCETEELQTLFNLVSVAYSLTTEDTSSLVQDDAVNESEN